VNGEYWVAPVTASGRKVSAVTITAITPAGGGGAESNPSDPQTYGILPGYPDYSVAKDIMTQLPYAAKPGESIIKMVRTVNECHTYFQGLNGCAAVYDVLTVLNDVPPACGSTVFRPPYAGTDKPLRTIDKVRMERLPRLADISAHPSRSTFTSIVATWGSPHYELINNNHNSLIFRAANPVVAVADYGADCAASYLGGVLSVFGTEDNAQKAPAVYTLMQHGFDNYAVYKLDIGFSSGAGQFPGIKPTIVFAAALYDEPQLITDIQAAAARPGVWFQEDEQVYITPHSTTPVWGNRDGGTGSGQIIGPGIEDRYWYLLFQKFIGNADNSKTTGDPYGYIDGSAGGPQNSSYQWCCSAGPFHSFVFAQHLMPYMEYANNDPEIIEYVDRIFNGRGFDNFSGGWWGAPDPCAKPDARENTDCDPRTGNCQYYKATWGPDPNTPGDCIKHNGDPLTDGRYGSLHGASFPPTGWSRKSMIAVTYWNRFRDCADPAHASYPCAGMGPEVGTTPIRRPLRQGAAPRLPEVLAYPSPMRESIVFQAGSGVKERSIRCSVLNSRGQQVAALKSRPGEGIILWDGRNLTGAQLQPGIYYYTLKAANGTHTGRIIKVAQ
jgi:hypothetical protein